MCYCCRKLDFQAFSMYFWEAVWGRERPWEAVWGRAPLIGSDRSGTLWHRSLSQWEEHGLTRPLTASHGLSLSASHRLGLSQFVMWSVWANQGSTASHAHGLSDLWGRGSPRCRSASHARRAMQSDPRGRLTDFTAKRIASAGVRERPIGLPHGLSRTLTASQIGLTDLRVRSVRPICEAVRGCGRPSTASQRDHMTLWWEAVVGLPRPHRFEISVRERPIRLYRPKQCV